MSGGAVTIGAAATPITLVANTIINTSSNNSALTIGGDVSGANKTLTLNSGTAVTTTNAIGSSGNGLGALTITANEFNPLANIFGQSTLVIKPSTSGAVKFGLDVYDIMTVADLLSSVSARNTNLGSSGFSSSKIADELFAVWVLVD